MTAAPVSPAASLVSGRRSVRRWATAGIGLGTVPGFGGAMWALCAWQAGRATRHPGVAPETVDAAGRVGPETARPAVVTWLGDSLAAGVGVDHVDDTPARTVARMLERSVDVRMLAVPGSRSTDVVEAQLPDLDPSSDLVVVCVGANDVASRTSRRSYSANLNIVLAATAPTPTVVLSFPDVTMADRMGQPLRWFAGLRARYFERARAGVVRRHDHAESVDIATMPDGLSRRAGREMLCADRFHPGPEVYRIWASRIAACAHPMLETRAAANAVRPDAVEDDEISV